MSLRKAATSGLFWTFLDTAVTRGIGLITSIILARILVPKDFGLMGMIYIVAAISSTLVDSGLTASLIRTRNIETIDYSTIFYTNIAISIFLYALVYLTAPSVAVFYNEPVLASILRVYGLIFVINSFSAVQNCRFAKKMQFRNLMLYNIPGIVIGAGIGIFMAYNDYGVWSIIAMQLVTQTILVIMLWVMSDWKPKIEFSWDKLSKHYNFGYKLMLSGLLNAGFINIYNVIIGKFFTTNLLGQYERASAYNNYPVTILTVMISKVTYPLLSNIQDEKERLVQVYRKILKFAFFVAAPLMLILSAIAEPLFALVLGPKWNIAAEFFEILCFAGLLYPIHAFNLNLLKVLGRSDLFLRLEVFKKLIIVVFACLSFEFGVIGLVWSAVLSSFGALFVNTYYTNKLINYSIWEQFKDLKYNIFTSVIMYFIMIFFLMYINIGYLWAQILTTALIGSIFYILVNILFKNESFRLVLQLRNNIK